MTSYSISDFSFNIGSTNIIQQYVPLVKEDVPWGINSTYIYKASTLRDQFDGINKHLVIENKCLSGNIIFKTQGTGKIIITDLSVGTINGLLYSGSGSGSGVGLTANSVNSSHIIDGSILGTDISEGTITTSNIAIGTITSSNILDGTILGTDISEGTITTSNIAIGTITSSNILDGTILGTDICGNTITDANIAEGTITEAKLVSAVQTKLNAVGVRGVFEISNSGDSDGGISVYLRCHNLDNSVYVDIFEDIEISVGETKYIPYTLPPYYGSKQFELLVDGDSNSLSSYEVGDSGVISDSIVNDTIVFNIRRNYAVNLQIFNILVG